MLEGDGRDLEFVVGCPVPQGAPVLPSEITLDGQPFWPASPDGVVIDASASPVSVLLTAEFVARLGYGEHVLNVEFSTGESLDASLHIVPDVIGGRTIQVVPGETSVYKGQSVVFDAQLSNMRGVEDTSVSWALTGATAADTRLDYSGDGRSARLRVAAGERAGELAVKAYLTSDPTVESNTAIAHVATVATAITVYPKSVTLRPRTANSQQFTATVAAFNGDRSAKTSCGSSGAIAGSLRRSSPVGGFLSLDPNETGFEGKLTVRVTSVAYPHVSAVATVYVAPEPMRRTTLDGRTNHGSVWKASEAVGDAHE